MIVKTLMEKLEKMDQNAIVRLNGAMGEEVLFIKKHAAEQSLDCDQSLVWLETESDVDMEKIPLFVKAGSIIPFGPVKQYTSQEEGENESLEIRIYPGADASFMIYEDEGNNYNYEKGQFSTIELNWNDAKKELEIGKRKGVFPGMKGKRTFNIVLVSPQSGVGISTSSSGVTVSYNGKATKLKIE